MVTKLKIILAMAVAVTASQAVTAFDSSIYSSSSLLASGKWVKISTTAEGIYQITYDQLREMGFPDPSKVQVYGYGSTQFADYGFRDDDPDDMVPAPTMHTADGRILFYGQGDARATAKNTLGDDRSITVHRNLYDTKSCYMLSDCRGTFPINGTTSVPPASTKAITTSHIHIEIVEDELYNPINGGAGFLGKQYQPGTTASFPVTIKNFQPTNLRTEGSWTYQFGISSSTARRLHVSTTSAVDTLISSNIQAYALNGSEFTAYYEARGYINFKAPEGSAAEIPTVFDVAIPAGDDYRICAVNRTMLRYPRANRLDAADPCLVMLHGEGENSSGQRIVFPDVENEGDVVLWDIENSADIRAISGTYDPEAHSITFVTSRPTMRTLAFNPAASYPTPAVEGDVANQDLHSMSVPDMVIITTPEYAGVSQRLAALHKQYQDMDVAVVDHNLIFNEFSSGTRDAMAYRRFLKMLYDRNPQKMRYLLLMGPVNYDNRCIQVPQADRLLCYENNDMYQMRNTISNYASDNFFGMLSDQYAHSNIIREMTHLAVGRVPALNVGQAEAYVTKAGRHLANTAAGAETFRSLFISDAGDAYTHLDHAEQCATRFSTNLKGGLPVRAHSSLLIPATDRNTERIHKLITDEILNGLGMFVYCGHGNSTSIGNSGLWDIRTASGTANNVYPLAIFSSCDQYAFDRNQSGLVETMLLQPEGGIVAGIGACRSVYISYNQWSCLSAVHAYSKAGMNATFGDIYMESRRIVIDNQNAGGASASNALLNVMNYNLAGDPALPARTPSYRISVEAPAAATTAIQPLKPMTISGSVTDADGKIIESFNGPVTLTLAAPPVTQTAVNTAGENNFKPRDVETQNGIAARADGFAVNGRFEVALVSPVPTTFGENRLIVSAVDTVTGLSALGSLENVTVEDYVAGTEPGEFSAPTIEKFAAGTPDFVAGGEVGASVDLVAVIDAGECGLRMSTEGVASGTSVTIDDSRRFENLQRYIRRNEDGMMVLTLPVDGLAEGVHTARLIAVNNADMPATATVDFNVVTRNIKGHLEVAENSARTEATIDLAGYSSPEQSRLIIADNAGNTVRTVENPILPYKWDLSDNSGNPVADGVYKATLILRDGADFGHTPTAEIVVLK